MAVATGGTSSNYLQRAPSPTGLYDVVDLILDKGLVLDAYIRVSVIGIELLTIDTRIVIASIDSYLGFAEAVNRLDLTQTETAGIDELRRGGAKAEEAGKHAVEGAKEKITPGGSKLMRVAEGAGALAAAGATAAVARYLAERGNDGDSSSTR